MESPPIPEQACPTCAAQLVLDGERQVCAACGRAFELTVVEADAGASVYRSAPIVDLAPLRYEVPWSGVIVARDDVELDLRICPAGVGRWGQWALRLASLASVVTGLFARPAGAYVIVGLGVGVFLLFLSAKPPPDHDAVTIVQTGSGPPMLRWTVERNHAIVQQSAAELGGLTGAHDGGDHVRIELSDGTAWKVGEGLRLSLASRRWLTWRLSKLSSLLGEGGDAYDGPSSKRILP